MLCWCYFTFIPGSLQKDERDTIHISSIISGKEDKRQDKRSNKTRIDQNTNIIVSNDNRLRDANLHDWVII